MCGILAIFGSTKGEHTLRQEARAASAKMRHRGPDWCGTKVICCIDVLIFARILDFLSSGLWCMPRCAPLSEIFGP